MTKIYKYLTEEDKADVNTFFNQSVEDTARELKVDVSAGLSEKEAQERGEKYGKNRKKTAASAQEDAGEAQFL